MDFARIRARRARIRHKYAPRITSNARAVEHHVRKLRKIHAKPETNSEAIALAGADYAEYHDVGFE